MIEIKNLTKRYGQQTIFYEANYTFPSNGLVCLLGASGCGKSTLIHMIAGFDREYSGEINIFGTSLHSMNESSLCSYRSDHVGFIFQNYNLISGYTVLDNILISCKSYKQDFDKLKKAEHLLNQLGILDKAKQRVENLSGGQKQRTAIARALMNHPSIILADEPTGALDRKNATEIMNLLKDISKNCIVFVITHDQKICEYADQIVTIEEEKIAGDAYNEHACEVLQRKASNPTSFSAYRRGLKNFRVHLKRYMAISFVLALGVLAFILSTSSSSILEKSIIEFKDKNTAFNNGYVKAEANADEVLKLLNADDRVEDVYEQFMLKDVTLTFDGKKETMAEKYPMPKAAEAMSYGIMPKANEHKIALSPSLAKKFQRDINQLMNQEIVLKYREMEYTLTISGIFNAGYDDFFVSSDIEQAMYQHISGEEPYAISYDVNRFEDVVFVEQMLAKNDIDAITAGKEVAALQNTFHNLNRLFLTISILILLLGLFISTILLVKLQNRRYQEIGLLSALGFHKKQIRNMVVCENIFLSISAAFFNVVLLGIVYFIRTTFHIPIIMSLSQIVYSVVGTGILVVFIGTLATYKLIHTEPAVALRK